MPLIVDRIKQAGHSNKQAELTVNIKQTLKQE